MKKKLLNIVICVYSIFNVNTFATQQIMDHISIGYNTVELSNSGINQFNEQTHNDFFDPQYNEFKNYTDCEFAFSSLEKLIQSFNEELKNNDYSHKMKKIYQIKNIFNDIFTEISRNTYRIEITFTLNEFANIEKCVERINNLLLYDPYNA